MDNMENNVQKTAEKPYTLRKLNDNDLWSVLNIIGIALPDELSMTFSQIVLKEKSFEEVGAEAITKLGVAIIRNMHKVHDEVYAFLADVSGIPAEDLQKMPFGTTPRMIMDIVKDVKNGSFFGDAS